MDSNSDDFDAEEDGSEAQLPSDNSVYSNPASLLSGNSGLFIQSSSSSLSDSISEETYTKQLTDKVRELKAELKTQCHLDWLSKFEPSEHNPKIELNLLLHGAIREQTLRQLALTKGIHFRNDEKIIAEIFQNDPSLLQRIFQEIISDQRQQRIIYTEILFRPDVFNFGNEISNIKVKNVMEIIIDCIRFFTSNNAVNNGKNTTMESNTILDKTMIRSSTPYSANSLSTHIKILLSCNWNNVKSMPSSIRLARDYPQEIVGFDFYGQEDDCRNNWPSFHKYTKILHHDHIRCQASMPNYKDLQLIEDVIKGLGIERLCEAYEIVLSSEHLENLLIKHGIHLVMCPVSDAYNIVNHQTNDMMPEPGKKRKYQSTSSLDNLPNEKNPNRIESFNLMNYLQSEFINHSITSLSPIEYKENLSSIYKNFFEKNKDCFTCEHMQWLNENAVKSSFASQKLKTELMNYLRESYSDCYKQTILLKQFQESTTKWQQEMSEIIDKNAQIAVEFAKKMRKDKILQRLNHQQERQNKLSEEENNQVE